MVFRWPDNGKVGTHRTVARRRFFHAYPALGSNRCQPASVEKCAVIYHDRGIALAERGDVLCSTRIRSTMSTTGKRYVARTGDHRAERVVDARARLVLRAVLEAPPGKTLNAYLQVTGARRA